MLPKHDDLRVEKVVKGNAPRALCAPQGGAETDEPGSVACALRFAFLHANRLTVRARRRQRRPRQIWKSTIRREAAGEIGQVSPGSPSQILCFAELGCERFPGPEMVRQVRLPFEDVRLLRQRRADTGIGRFRRNSAEEALALTGQSRNVTCPFFSLALRD
jgi:hypothetical protein